MGPAYAPDGKRITFQSDSSGSTEIVRADGAGVPNQLTTDPSIDTNPDWFADGKWIYFSSERSGQQAIWKVLVEGGEAVAVSNIFSDNAVESPDGQFLYYEKGWPNEFSLMEGSNCWRHRIPRRLSHSLQRPG